MSITKIAHILDGSLVKEFEYQQSLTQKLDLLHEVGCEFTQEIINEIVLWKVNRYAKINNKTLSLINRIKPDSTEIDEELTKQIICQLLERQKSNENEFEEGNKGFGLPMISTVLRFKNPNIYQIIDQRVYRLITEGEDELKLTGKSPSQQADLYLNYLIRLREVTKNYFNVADRLLYIVDKKENSKVSLKGYGAQKTT